MTYTGETAVVGEEEEEDDIDFLDVEKAVDDVLPIGLFVIVIGSAVEGE